MRTKEKCLDGLTKSSDGGGYGIGVTCWGRGKQWMISHMDTLLNSIGTTGLVISRCCQNNIFPHSHNEIIWFIQSYHKSVPEMLRGSSLKIFLRNNSWPKLSAAVGLLSWSISDRPGALGSREYRSTTCKLCWVVPLGLFYMRKENSLIFHWIIT